MLEAIADPIRLSIVRHIDEHGPASLSELAAAAGVHFNTARPHILALEESGVLRSRQRAARGPGRRVIEYYLADPLALTGGDFVGIAELLAGALGRAGLDPDQLHQIGADWGRYLSGRPARRDPSEQVPRIVGRLGYRVQVSGKQAKLSRCLCPLISPDSPLTVCGLIEGVVDGALAASGTELRVVSSQHDPDARSCQLQLDSQGR